MSVINSMLRDLDRRHAPLPVKDNIQPAPAQRNRVSPRSAIALCALLILVVWNWNHPTKKSAAADIAVPAATKSTQPVTTIAEPTAPQQAPLTTVVSATKTNIAPAKTDNALIQTAASRQPEVSDKRHAAAAEKMSASAEMQQVAPIIKQERRTTDDVDAERYQLARNALAQNLPERAYELLRENPPALLGNTDYHAVLAAVEQQLGHYADASLRYQQLLTLDQQQASWWLGLALSLEASQRGSDALAAYRHANQLNSLPDAARQYATARIAALSHSAEQ